MKILLDTSVWVAGLVESHREHGRALPWLRRAVNGEYAAYVAAHTLAELFAVLTRLPQRPPTSPVEARALIRRNVEEHAEIVALSGRDYRVVIDEAAEAGLGGGIVYDALLVRAARKAEVDRILTLNPRHFLRIWPSGEERVVAP